MKTLFRQILPVLCLGLGAGFLNGVLGAGGGILVVAGLNALLGKKIEDKRAIFASAIAVMLPLSALSVWRYLQNGHLEEGKLGIMIIPAVAGGAIGAWLLKRISPRGLSGIFAVVVLVSGVIMLL